jgi:hypothetical protein
LEVAEFRGSNSPVAASEREAGWVFLALLIVGIAAALFSFLGGSHLTPARQMVVLECYALCMVLELAFASHAALLLSHTVMFVGMSELRTAKQRAISVLDALSRALATGATSGTTSPPAAAVSSPGSSTSLSAVQRVTEVTGEVRPSSHANGTMGFNSAAIFFSSLRVANELQGSKRLAVGDLLLQHSQAGPPPALAARLALLNRRV